MKNIWKIFRADVSHIKNNVIALIVILGLTVVPALYAWFNIAASWDPYSNTGGIRVAVANADEGYESSIVPVKINMGDTVISSLRANEQMDWVFTDKKKAVEGVRSGKYYAAIVIPKAFSKDMMTVFSDDVTHSSLIYYSNQKENAIAPKVTDKGADSIRTQIDEIFTKTISQIGLDVMNSLSSYLNQDGTRTMIGNLAGKYYKKGWHLDDLRGLASTMTAFSDMMDSMQGILDTTSSLLKQSGESTEAGLDVLKDTGEGMEGLSSSLSGTTEVISQVLEDSGSYYQAVSQVIDETFASMEDNSQNAASSLLGLSDVTQSVIDKYTDFRDSLAAVRDALPVGGELLNPLISNMEELTAGQQALKDKLDETAEKITDTAADIGTYHGQLQQMADDSVQQISSVQSDYEENLQAELGELFGTLGDTGTSVANVMEKLDDSLSGLGNISDSASSDLAEVRKALDTSASLLTEAADKIEGVSKTLGDAVDSQDSDVLKNLIGSDPASLSSVLAAPVKLNRTAVYSVENYGSSMAPFYSSLAIWVGGIVLVAMMKVNVSQKTTDSLKNVKEYQMYLGRYILFFLMGLLQSGLICLGDLYYLGIQCEHPFLFVLAGWMASVAFVNLIYTLTVSFGDIGKAICVVLLVIQVAGSGGTFPIEVAPAFFKKVYLFLPFTHSMAAMRECIGGLYGNTYWTEMGRLGLFLAASLLLGLVLRKPVIRLNHAFMEKLESTKIM